MEKIQHSKLFIANQEQEIKRLEAERARLLKSKREAYDGGKSFHDPIEVNSEFREIDEQVLAINYKISEIQKELDNSVVLEQHGRENFVDYGKVYELTITNAKGEAITSNYILMAEATDITRDSKYAFCSRRSALGCAIYERKIGETVTFTTPSKEVKTVTIVREVLENEEQNEI